jgi:diguanylate cyclase (GGDEF)-like protein
MNASSCQPYEPTAQALQRQQAAGCRCLRFEKQLERLFQADLFAGARSTRLSLLIVLAALHLATPLYYVPLLSVPETFIAGAYAWQYGHQLPAILVALMAVWLWPAPRLNTGLCIFAFCAIVIGVLGQRAMGMTHDFHVPVEFAAIAIAGFMIGIRVVFCRALPWAIAAALAILASEWLFVPDSPAATYHALCALVLVGIALFWGYSIGLAERDTRLKTRLLDHLARHDSLTGLLNRMALDQALRSAFDYSAGASRSVTLTMVDIDYFKAYNDHYGHARGDDVIAQVACLCEAAIRPSRDICARYGGEEIVMLWVDRTFDEACAQTYRLQQQLALCDIAHVGSPIAQRLTLSIGLFHVTPDQIECFARADHTAAKSPGARLIEIADRLLYRAKNDGRNRVVADHGPHLHELPTHASPPPATRPNRPGARIA